MWKIFKCKKYSKESQSIFNHLYNPNGFKTLDTSYYDKKEFIAHCTTPLVNFIKELDVLLLSPELRDRESMHRVERLRNGLESLYKNL
jgi:hypothetical protein